MKFQIINVKDVNNENIGQLTSECKYVLLEDKSATLKFENMTKAVNLFLDAEWKIIGLSGHTHGERLGLDYILHILLAR